MKIFLINNNLRYKNNFILEKACKEGGIVIYINPYMSWMEKNKYIWESYNLLDLQKKLPIKIIYLTSEKELINFLINLEDKNFKIYGDIYFIRRLKIIINIQKEDKDLKDKSSFEFHENFQKLNIEYNVVKSNTLLISNSYEKEYKVYTAFKNYYINQIEKFNIIENYDFSKLKNNSYEEYYMENQLKELKDLPPYEFSENFPIGEEAAYKRWEDFKDSIKDYEVNKNIPYLNNTSKLSPYINSGIISVEIIWNDLLNMDQAHTLIFKQELLWREFAYHTYYYNPNMIFKSINEKFEKIPWKYNEDNEDYNKWAKGETGFLIVDGGMKELNTTGYMFNRCRMIIASFLIKNLKVHWYVGANYFMRHLLDGDYVINAFNWQWINGSGRDAAPYFRIFNPILQLEKFDKDLLYIGKYLDLKNYEKAYPPIIDFKKSREEILALYKKYIKDI